MITEDEYRASMRDRTCLLCDAPKAPWWSLPSWLWQVLTWEFCTECRADYCRTCAKRIWSGSRFAGGHFTCSYCGFAWEPASSTYEVTP